MIITSFTGTFYAFDGCNIDTVYMGRTVKASGYMRAYFGTAVKVLTIGNYVTSIGDYAFSSCTELKKLTIADGTSTLTMSFMGNCYAFNGCNIDTVYMGRTVKASEYKGAYFGTAVKVLTIGNYVTSIGNNAFSRCAELKKLTIADGTDTLALAESTFSYSNVDTVYMGRTVRALDLFNGTLFGRVVKFLTISTNVTFIENSAFSGCSSLTSVAIPSSVTSIRYNAFSGCNSLTFVIIPYGVTSIEANAFSDCSGLTSVTIPNSVASIGYNAFSGCSSLTSVSIPYGVTSIVANAFSGCSSLTSVAIPSSVTSIGYSAFNACSRLTSVTIPSSVTSIEAHAFGSCAGLKKLTIADGTDTLTLAVNAFSNNFIDTVYMGRTVKASGYKSAYFGTAVKVLTIGNYVTSIGSNAFQNCTLAGTLVIPNSVTTIGANAFSGCSALRKVAVEDGTTALSFGSSAFGSCPIDTAYLGRNVTGAPFNSMATLKSLTIGNGVTSIENSAFQGTSLTQLILPNSIITIGSNAFQNCTLAGTLVIPNSVTTIGANAFSGCSALRKVAVEDGTSPLFFGSTAFGNCFIDTVYLGRDITGTPFSSMTTLKSLTISNSVNAIEENAFTGCEQLHSINCHIHTPLTISEGTFPPATTYVPKDAFAAYAEAAVWKDRLYLIGKDHEGKLYNLTKVHAQESNLVTVNGSSSEYVTSLWGDSISVGLAHHAYFTINGKDYTAAAQGSGAVKVAPLNVNHVHAHSFNAATSYTVHVAVSGTLIDTIGVTNVDNVQALVVSGNLNSTDILTIRKMTNLEVLDMSEASIVGGGMSYYQDFNTSANAIGSYFFKEKTKLGMVRLPNSVTTIGQNTFEGCANLHTVYIANAVKAIGASAFEGCVSLANAAIPNSVSSMGANAFKGCISLTQFTIPSSVSTIGSYAFDGCTQLRSVVVENGTSDLSFGIINISEFAFRSCPIETLYVGRNISYGGSGANHYSPFKGKATLKQLTVGSLVSSIGSYMFDGCTSLRKVDFLNGAGALSFGTTSYSELTFRSCPIDTLHLGRVISYYGSGVNYYSPFKGKTALKVLTVGSTVSSMGSHIFDGCTALHTVVVEDTTSTLNFSTPYSENAFRGSPIATLYLGRNISYNSSISPFAGKTSLTSLTLGSRISAIGTSLFQGCSGISGRLTLPSAVTTIGANAFQGCVGLTDTLVIPSGATTIGASAFQNCSGFVGMLTIPNSVTTIGSSAFQNCRQLTELTISHAITLLNGTEFAGCNALERVTLGRRITSIGCNAFAHCPQLRELNSTSYTPPVAHATAFTNVDKEKCVLNVPESSVTLYWLHPVWEEFYSIQGREFFRHDATLKSVEVNQGTLMPSFHPDSLHYTVSVPNEVASITLTATPNDSAASISGDGVKTLTAGANAFNIVAMAEDWIATKTYVVTVVRAKSTNADLSTLTTGYTLVPSFNADSTYYTVNVANSTTSIFLNAAKSHSMATLSGIGLKTLNVWANTFHIVVTAEDTTVKKTYTVVVNRAPSTNANLGALTVSSGVLSPYFNANTTNYTVNVGNSVDSVVLNATANHSGASVSGAGTKKLSVGANTFTLVATAEDTVTTKTYTVVVNRAASTDATLNALTVSEGTLSPTFSAAITYYTVNVANGVGSITLNATANHSGASMSGAGTKNLSVGSNSFYIVVTAENGITTRTYTVVVVVNAVTNAVAPTITTQPLSATYYQNAMATVLSVTANVTDGGTLSYQWYSNTTNSTSGGTAVGTGSSYIPLTNIVGTTYYFVVVTNTNHAAGSATTAFSTSRTAKVTVNAATTTSVSSEAVTVVKVYPNPITNGVLNIESEEVKGGEAVEVYSLSGVLVARYKATSERTSLNVSHLASGTYILRVGKYTAKFVKH